MLIKTNYKFFAEKLHFKQLQIDVAQACIKITQRDDMMG